MLTTAKPIFSTLRAGLTAGVLAMALTACGTTNWGFPYRPDIQQGNWITAEQVAQLRQGMTREQVRFILGTPTLQDVFRTNRWDYPYYNKPGYGAEEERKFTVWFEGDTLVRWEGDNQPNRQPYERTDTGAGAIDADAAQVDEDESPLLPETSPPVQSSPIDTGAAAGAPPASEESDEPADRAQPEAGSAERRESGAIFNTYEPRPANPGVPTPGRDTAEPLR